ncbi:hypothetical protein WA158_006425 [Blastocystis sp. Blastoise]
MKDENMSDSDVVSSDSMEDENEEVEFSQKNALLEKRKRNIKRKKQLLHQFGIDDTVKSIFQEQKERIKKHKKERNSYKVQQEPQRKSLRLQGLKPEIDVTMDTIDKIARFVDSDIQKEHIRNKQDDIYNNPDYWKDKINGDTVISQGRFTGWVEPGVCQRLGICETEQENDLKYAHGRRTSGLNFKELAKASLHSKPNCYFYRFCEPNVKQWLGEWTNEEIDLFIDTARRYGCGDQWGIFSTYIPHRVGYQCANFYRQYAIPRGLVVDAHYLISTAGKVTFKANGELNKLLSHNKTSQSNQIISKEDITINHNNNNNNNNNNNQKEENKESEINSNNTIGTTSNTISTNINSRNDASNNNNTSDNNNNNETYKTKDSQNSVNINNNNNNNNNDTPSPSSSPPSLVPLKFNPLLYTFSSDESSSSEDSNDDDDYVCDDDDDME